MSTLKERLKPNLQLLKDHGVNILKLSYPLSLQPYGTFVSPEELALKLLDLTDKEMEALIPALKACQTFGSSYGEIDVCTWEPVKVEARTKEELGNLYKEFKTEVKKSFKALPLNLQKRILAKDKPKLKPYIITESMIRVFLTYAGEELSYALYLNTDRDMLKLKANLLVFDLRDIAEGKFLGL